MSIRFLYGYALLTFTWTNWVLHLGVWHPTFWYLGVWPRRVDYYLGFDLYGLGPLFLLARLPSPPPNVEGTEILSGGNDATRREC